MFTKLPLIAAWFSLAPFLSAQEAYKSHSPMRPLPAPSDRPFEKGTTYFVHPTQGDDANDGELKFPWRTVAHAAKKLRPGDTLVLRKGVYHEHVVLTASGTPKLPITIRSHPGEIAIIDGGLPEFWHQPEQAWEPVEGGAPGEYRSKKIYPNLGGSPDGPNLLGRFGDSMIPLHGYRYLSDLRSATMYWTLKKNTAEEEKGLYCGPGVFYDLKSGHIHVRLAHTSLKMLGEDNYRGETDPRKLPLVIGAYQGGPALTLRGVEHVRLQDLVLRGTRGPTLDILESTNIELDGLTIYGGSPAVQVKDSAGLRMLHTACRGISAPWTFRGSLKYRSTEARIFSASGWEPTGADNRRFELAYSEFTDCVDGVFLGNVRAVDFHHNLVDNISDDGLYLTATTGFDGTTHGGDVRIHHNLLSRCLTTFAFGVGQGRQRVVKEGRQTGAGVFIYRNVCDFRRLVHYHIPTGPDVDGQPEPVSHGRFASDHGSPTWEPMFIYHNTILADDRAAYSYGTHGLGDHISPGTKRRVFNNIIVQMHGLPGSWLPPTTADFQGDANLHWSLQEGPAFKGDLFEKFRKSKDLQESKKQYPPGWAVQDRFADPRFTALSPDWRKPVDLALSKESPALDVGVILPKEWPDHERAQDQGKPDLGALPAGVAPWRIGTQGRLTMFGGASKADKMPMATLPPLQAAPLLQYRTQVKPAAVVRGYPGRDGAYLLYALKKHGIPVDVHDIATGTWLDTRDYAQYGLVAILGNLARAKLEPNVFSKDDLPRVQKFLENGGTLLLLRLGPDVFAGPDGRDFLSTLTAAAPAPKKVEAAKLALTAPDHAWLKHLNPKADHPWLNDRLVIPLHVGQGTNLIGSADGKQTILHRLPVGKGQLIYLGWELSEYLPTGAPATPPTLEQERIFEDQVGILMKIVADVYRAK